MFLFRVGVRGDRLLWRASVGTIGNIDVGTSWMYVARWMLFQHWQVILGKPYVLYNICLEWEYSTACIALLPVQDLTIISNRCERHI